MENKTAYVPSEVDNEHFLKVKQTFFFKHKPFYEKWFKMYRPLKVISYIDKM